MQSPAQPSNEPRRVAALHALQLLDTPAEERFDRLTRVAQTFFKVPIVLISLVDTNRQWFKSRQGLDACETGRDISFCGHAINHDHTLVIENASRDARFADNPLVTGPPDIRFYAGCPLHSEDGYRIGTLCLIDTEARQFSPVEEGHLRDFANMVEQLIRERSQELGLDTRGRRQSLLTRWAAGQNSPLGRRRTALALGLLAGACVLLVGYLHQGLLVAAAATLTAALVYILLRLPSRLRQTVEHSIRARNQTERRFRDALEALPDGFAVFDSQRKLLYFNSALLEIYAPCREAIQRGRSYTDISRDFVNAGLFKLPPTSEEDLQPMSRRVLPLSDGRWVRTIEEPMRDGGTLSVHTDITSLKLKEQELAGARDQAEAANAAKTRFIANISHEVRTPMNGVLGLIDVLLDHPDTSQKQRYYLTTARNSGRHLMSILNDVIDISRLESGQLTLQPEPFDLNASLREVAELLAPEIHKKGLQLQVDLDPALAGCWQGDVGRIRQVVINLMHNALKFTEQGSLSLSSRQLTTRERDTLVQICVSDTGIGIAREAIDSLFEPFQQLPAGSEQRADGAGLGLSICKNLVELMGGAIHIHLNDAAASGTRVELELPLFPADEAAIATERSIDLTPRQLGWPPVRLLLAEDNAINRLVVEAMLSDSGYQLDIVNDGQAAVTALNQQKYDLILMDVFMPVLDGVSATRQIRNQRLSDAPIIALTANALESDRKTYLEAGMSACLSKPVDKQELLTTLHHWLAPRFAPRRA